MNRASQFLFFQGGALLGGGVRLAVPSGFGWTPPFGLFRSPAGVYSTNIDVNAFIPPVSKTYYVNMVTGGFGNPGTAGSPLLTIKSAFTKSDVDQVIIQQAGVQAANGAYIAWGDFGWNGTTPTRSVSIIPANGSRVVFVGNDTTTPPTWTKTAGLTNVYQATSVGGVNHLNGPVDLKYLDGNGDFVITNKVASSAAVDATPNSYYYDGTSVVYVRATDSRSLISDPYMTSGYPGGNGILTSSNPITLWVTNCDFVGGAQSFVLSQSSIPAGTPPSFYCINSTFQGSVTTEGFVVNGQYTVVLKGCRSTNNWSDGFGYHAANSSPGPNCFEFGCSTGFNGRGNSGSDQSSSAHDAAHIISLNPAYAGSANQTINDILSSQRWLLGGNINAPVQTDLNGNTLQLGASVKHWVDGTLVGAANTYTLALNGAGSVLNYRNSALNLLTKNGPGTLQTY